MAVLLDAEELDLDGLRQRVETLSADGVRTAINVGPGDGSGGPTGGTGDMATVLTALFAPTRHVTTVHLSGEVDVAMAVQELHDTGADALAQPLDIILLAIGSHDEALPAGYHPVGREDFDTVHAAVAALGREGMAQADIRPDRRPDRDAGLSGIRTVSQASDDQPAPPPSSPSSRSSQGGGADPSHPGGLGWESEATRVAPPVRREEGPTTDLHVNRHGLWTDGQAVPQDHYKTARRPWRRYGAIAMGLVGFLVAAAAVFLLLEPSGAPRPGDQIASMDPEREQLLRRRSPNLGAEEIQGAGIVGAQGPGRGSGERPDTLYAQRSVRLYEKADTQSEVAGFIPARTAVTITGDYDPAGWSAATLESGKTGFIFTPLFSTAQFDANKDLVVRIRDCPACPLMMFVRAGQFLMGSGEDDPGHQANEAPKRLIRLPSPLLVSRSEVSRREWAACVADGVCEDIPQPEPSPMSRVAQDRLPVSGLSFEDAQAYVGWLNERTGRRYRLPTEAEWEFSAQAGKHGPFHFGSSISLARANYDASISSPLSLDGQVSGGPVGTGTLEANGFGLTEMHGNVAELTADCWLDTHEARPRDGSIAGPGTGDCAYRAARGGSWRSPAEGVRTTARYRIQAGERIEDVGLRIVRDL